MSCYFKTDNISVGIGGRIILEGISFSLEKGRLGMILGPNGVGKTSLLRTISGLIEPVGGEIYVRGQTVKGLKRTEMARFFAYVPQNSHFVYDYNVRDFVVMGRTPYLGILGMPDQKDMEIASDAMRFLGITDLERRSILSLSGGERQMVLLARSLAQEAMVMLLDEPTANLDYHKQHSFLESLKELVSKRGITAVVSLHDPNLALKFADKIVMIHEKRILAELDSRDTGFITRFDVCLKRMYGDHAGAREYDDGPVVFWKS